MKQKQEQGQEARREREQHLGVILVFVHIKILSKVLIFSCLVNLRFKLKTKS